MSNKFDELTKSLAQSVTRRAALNKIGVGLAGMALACFGLANNARAGNGKACATDADCAHNQVCCNNVCVARVPDWCDTSINPCCCYCRGGNKNTRYGATALTPCDPGYNTCSQACSYMPC